ncbi:DUF742 domain-containing protein [Nocardiopsis sp. NPDC058631]|uniref:DUF742 domain-containing protein n=1 Tax=Nocardiopsis sp. NPDC058631 TaxID=3346566 RepID=UPI00365A03F2
MSAEGASTRRTVGGAFETVPGPTHDRPAGCGEERFLRPFAVAAGDPEGRALDGSAGAPTPSGIDLLTLVVSARTPGRGEWLRPEREAILDHALHARTVVELAAEVGLPVGQVRGIVCDMVAEGALQRCGPSRPLRRGDIPHAVLVGLRSL